MRKIVSISLLVLMTTLLSFKGHEPYVQTKDTRAVLKALYIYNFATLTDWPSNYKSGDFVIGVLGESSVFDELQKKYRGKVIGRQKIVVDKVTESEIGSKTIHLLFVPSKYSSKLGNLSSTLKNKSTMIVGENSGSLSSGAVINFIVENNKQSYEISKRNARNRNLVIASKLVDLASRVE